MGFTVEEYLLQYTVLTGKTTFLGYLYASFQYLICLSVFHPCPVQFKNLLPYPVIQLHFFHQLFHFFPLTFLDKHSLFWS